jgi:hypothetical protein
LHGEGIDDKKNLISKPGSENFPGDRCNPYLHSVFITDAESRTANASGPKFSDQNRNQDASARSCHAQSKSLAQIPSHLNLEAQRMIKVFVALLLVLAAAGGSGVAHAQDTPALELFGG